MNLYDETDVLGNEPAPHPIAADAALSAMLAASPQPAAPVAECTNEDSWNCKYCRKTETCAALKDERNFGAPPKAARQEQGDEVRRLREALERIAKNAAWHTEIGNRPDLITLSCWVSEAHAALSASAEGKV